MPVGARNTLQWDPTVHFPDAFISLVIIEEGWHLQQEYIQNQSKIAKVEAINEYMFYEASS